VCRVDADGRMILQQVQGERWEVALLLLLRLLSRPVYARSTAHLEQVSPTRALSLLSCPQGL